MVAERASERWRRLGDYLARNYNGTWLEFDLDTAPSEAQVVGVTGVFHVLRSLGTVGHSFEAPERSLEALFEPRPGTRALPSAVMSVARRGRPRYFISLSPPLGPI